VSGLLFGEVGVSLFESGEEKGVFVSQSSVFVAQSGIFLAQGLGPSLCGGEFLVSPVQRLIAELLGLLFPVALRRGIDQPFCSYERSLP
jgi:hypothetical protein